jgi:hypothetical protein
MGFFLGKTKKSPAMGWSVVPKMHKFSPHKAAGCLLEAATIAPHE